jgi:hypothetical protein
MLLSSSGRICTSTLPVCLPAAMYLKIITVYISVIHREIECQFLIYTWYLCPVKISTPPHAIGKISLYRVIIFSDTYCLSPPATTVLCEHVAGRVVFISIINKPTGIGNRYVR